MTEINLLININDDSYLSEGEIITLGDEIKDLFRLCPRVKIKKHELVCANFTCVNFTNFPIGDLSPVECKTEITIRMNSMGFRYD